MQFLQSRFVVIDSNAALCRKWGEVRGDVKQTGNVIETADAWIAATALVYAATLVTHNAADFAQVPNLTIVSEK